MGTGKFYYNGGWQVWSLPAGVTQVFVTCEGAGSGGVPGGKVSGMLTLGKGSRLYIAVGGAGGAPTGAAGGAGGWPRGGAGGNGHGKAGGGGGAGYTAVRLNATSGKLLCLAGGAGGGGGLDGSPPTGGKGGDANGQAGGPTIPGQTLGGGGGTQSAGGLGGVGMAGPAYIGGTGQHIDYGGVGGGYAGKGGATPTTVTGAGGGGGGGGVYGGGGGVASYSGFQSSGGGGGGSNYHGSLGGGVNEQGTGRTGYAVVTLSWDDPATANRPPGTPSGVIPSNNNRTLSIDHVVVSAIVSDPDGGAVRAMFRISTDPTFKHPLGDYNGQWMASGQRSQVSFDVTPNTRYYMHVYAQDEHGVYSRAFISTVFYSDYAPNAPTLSNPAQGALLNPAIGNIFRWTFSDPDGGVDAQTIAHIDYRPVGAGVWTTVDLVGAAVQWTAPASTFDIGTSYQWRVRVEDKAGLESVPSTIRTFTTAGVTSVPYLLAPTNQAALQVDSDTTFKWRFRDIDPGDHQSRADLRYRTVGIDADWITIPNVSSTSTQSWLAPAGTFQADQTIEWQVRTYDSTSNASPWTGSWQFHAIHTPGWGNISVDPGPTVEIGPLGCGFHRVFVYDRGGTKRLGEITPIQTVQWGRVRDDISSALLDTTGFDDDCCELLSNLRSMRHELVIFRGTQRVWEGPVTRIAYFKDHVQIEARDVMQYVYRRILRAGYNDSYPNTQSVVMRSAQIIIDALARDDPNVLAYLTEIDYPNDVKQSRIRFPYQVTAWEEVDDMAATAGLDYTVLARRIMLWDTHRPIGRLPLMQDGDFLDNPVVTEYGMQLGTYFAVTNNSGAYGAVGGFDHYYGLVEHLASSYAESAAGGAGTGSTPAALIELQESLAAQANRNAKNANPSPLVVRIPDNTALNPEIQLDIQQLVPGVWIPLRSTATCRFVTQWQKLDSMSVSQDQNGEAVTVVMSPAPGGGDDPDADTSAVG